jgi:hypothetical protein
MTERYGPGSGDEGGQRPSGRGAATERLARRAHGDHEIDLTDEAAARDAGDDTVAGPGARAEPEPADRASSGAFEPAAPTADPPAGTDQPGSPSIFDVDERARQEELNPTGYEPPVADADGDAPRGETNVTEPGERGDEVGEAGDEPGRARAADAGQITPTPVPVAEPAADVPPPHGLPEPAAAGVAVPAAAGAEDAGASGSPLSGTLDTAEIRNRFLDIQADFIDEPRQAVEEAGRFVDDLVRQVADALHQQRAQLTGAGDDASTEDLRLALRAYRQFVDRLLGLAG